MSKKPENNFIDSVNKLLPIKKKRLCVKALQAHPQSKHLHYEKMNNPYSSGTWDGWYSGLGGDLWIEYKFLPRIPQRGTVNPLKLLSTLQADWGNERYAEGRNVAVIIGCPSGGVLLLDRRWEVELSARDFVSQIRSRENLAAWILEQTTR